MSKTKFLGIPEGGKRAGWIEMEGGSAGGGGNDREFIIDATRGADDTISSKTTFDEVVAAVKSRKVPVLYCDGPDGYLLKNTSHLVYAEGTTVNAVTFQFEHASAGFVIVVEPSGWLIG